VLAMTINQPHNYTAANSGINLKLASFQHRLGALFLVAWYVTEIVFYFTKGQRTLRDILVKTLVVNEA
jgi:hypothetical protein